MSRSEKWRTFSADFETTVEENTRQQTATEVWSAASVELWTEDVMVFHSIGELYEYYVSLNENIVVYFHNLKFDGNFWLSYLLYDLKFKTRKAARSKRTGKCLTGRSNTLSQIWANGTL